MVIQWRFNHYKWWFSGDLPSGKGEHNYGKSQISIDKSTISMGHGFNSKLLVITRG
jgi:hypothetical protein